VNVLLVRIDGIGDAIVCAPLVAALRDAGHTVGALLTTRNAEAFAEGTFAHVHVVERIPWPEHGSTATSYAAALAGARAARYDAALVISEEPEAYRFALECGATTRAGFTNGWEKPLKSVWTRSLLTHAHVREASAWRARGHEVEAIFALGAGLHGERAPTRDLRRLRPLVAGGDARADDAADIALQVARKIHATPAGAAEFRAIARGVADRHRAVVVAAEDDAELARSLAAQLGLDCRTYARVACWRDALADARAVVTPDGGAAHLAGMAGVPCVDLFRLWPHAAYDVRRWRPWAAPARTLLASSEPAATAAAVLAAFEELPLRARTVA
jgi:ADP-heptose:LPS heptosyltransferase